MKLMGLLLGGVLLAVPSVAGAEPLWDKVEAGMTRQQVEALYPKDGKTEYQKNAIEISGIHILGKCDAEANIRFNDANVVKEVMIAGNPSMGGRCSQDIMSAMSAKYGQPANWDGSSGTFLSRQGKIMMWSRPDGVAMRFKKYENGLFGGGGLLKASWELTYSKVDKEFAL